MNQQAVEQESRPKQVFVAVLKTGNGRFVGSESSEGAPVRADGSVGDLFEITEWGAGFVALKPFSSGGYLSVRPGATAVANSREIGPKEIFQLVYRDGDKTALRLVDGAHYLSASTDGEIAATAKSVGESEMFVIEKIEVESLPAGGHGCCGSWMRQGESEAGILWNDETHSEIVEWAVHGMRDKDIQTPEAALFVQMWDSKKGFDQQVKKGLKDADYEAPWRGYMVEFGGTPIPFLFMYQNHFYDPKTEKNYMRERSSAVTEGRRCFNLAVHAGMRIFQLKGTAPDALYQKAAYYLGLSLHFLTDLTQPMHASNFGNVYADHYPRRNLIDFRHKNFEDFTEENIKGFFKGTRLQARDLQLGDIVDVRWFLHHTAVNQRKVYDEILKPVIDKKGFLAPWTKEDSIGTWQASLKAAPGAVARYLAYWSHCITQTLNVSSNHWYRIKEPTMGENICLHGGYFKRSPDTGGHSKYFLLFNQDGTWSMATQDYKSNLWFINDFGTLAEYKGASGDPHSRAKFRFVPNSPGSANFWIFESSKDEVVGVASDAYCYRWPPYDIGTQLFRLEDAGEISASDEATIRKSFGHFGQLPWYGSVVA